MGPEVNTSWMTFSIATLDMDLHLTCKSTAPALKNISSTLSNLCIQNVKRMDIVEERVTRLEQNTKELVKEEISNSKGEIVGLMKEDIIAIVDSRNKELDDRRNKSNNLILFNINEPDGDRPLAPNEDLDTIHQISNLLIGENLKMHTHYRLGKNPEVNKIRPLVVLCESKEQRKKARTLKDLAPERLKKIVVSRDLTILQREERKKYLAEKRSNDHRPPVTTSPPELQPLLTK